jgi:hypothetical protein
MQDVGYAALQIIPSFKGLDRNLEQGTSGALVRAGSTGGAKFGESAGRSAGRRFGSIFATAAKVGLVGLGALGVGAFKLGKDAIGQASDLNESLNAVNVTYGDQAKAVRELGSEAATALGLSNSEFNGLAVQFSAFATQVAGGDGPKVVGVLDDLATRGADFASVMNLEVNEAMGLFQSGLAGETEPLRKFGIDLSAAKVEAYAYAKGIAKQGEELTEAEKVQARYGSLMEQTNKTAGDFANTSDSLANRQRILNARWDDAQAKLGTALLPVMEDVAGFLLDEGIPAFEKASDWFVENGIPAISDFAGEMKPLAKEVGPALVDVFGGIRDAAETAAPYVKDLVGFFNDLPSEAKVAALGGALAGFGALKAKGGGSALSGVASAVGLAKPVPVFVTNPGFGGAGVGGAGGKAILPGGKTPAGTGGGILATLMGFPLPALGALGADQGTHTAVKLPKSDPLSLNFASQIGPSPSADQIQDWVKYRNELKDTADSFKLLPDAVKTNIALNGAPESRREAKELVRQYDLTPKEKRTLFRVLDIEPSKNSTRQLQDVLAKTPKGVNTHVTVSGIAEARNQVDGLTGALNTMTNAANTAVSAAANAVAAGSRGRTKYND